MNNLDYKSMFNHIPVGTLIVSQDFKVLFWNAWLEAHTGIMSANAIGHPFHELFQGIDTARFDWAIEKAVKSLSPQILSQPLNHFLIPIEVAHAKSHGISNMQQHVEIIPLQTESGEMVALVTIIDVTINVLHASLLVELADQLQFTDDFDPPTGLLNRKYLWKWMKSQFQLAMHQQYSISCMILEIDHVKQLVNDPSDEVLASELLKELVESIRGPLRQSDLILRYDQWRLAVLLPSCEMCDAKKVANKLCEQAAVHSFRLLPKKVTISVGVAGWSRLKPCTIEELLRNADRKLFKAKNQGGNQAQS